MKKTRVEKDIPSYADSSGLSVFFFRHLQLDIENEVNNEMANRMSLFYAEATPMLKTLSNATTNFVTEVRVLALHHSTGQNNPTAAVFELSKCPSYRPHAVALTQPSSLLHSAYLDKKAKFQKC